MARILLAGAEVRVDPGVPDPSWDAARRETYLLRRDVARVAGRDGNDSLRSCYDNRRRFAVDESASSQPRNMARRRLRVGVYRRVGESGSIVAEKIFPAGDDVTLAATSDAGLAVPGWIGPPLMLIERGDLLRLEPGMRVNMCHDGGLDHVVGTFEELEARGVSLPIKVNVAGLNIRVRDDISVFARYLADDAPPP